MRADLDKRLLTSLLQTHIRKIDILRTISVISSRLAGLLYSMYKPGWNLGNVGYCPDMNSTTYFIIHIGLNIDGSYFCDQTWSSQLSLVFSRFFSNFSTFQSFQTMILAQKKKNALRNDDLWVDVLRLC